MLIERWTHDGVRVRQRLLYHRNRYRNRGQVRLALKAVKELKPDILVLDISMPVMDGIETAQRLRQANSKTRIVFLTVHDDPEFASAAMDAGAMGYVIKSRMVSDLLVAINEVYAGRTFVSPLRAGLAGKQGK